MFPQALQESSGVSGVCFDKRPWGHVVSQSLFSTKKQSTEPPNLKPPKGEFQPQPESFSQEEEPIPEPRFTLQVVVGRGQWRSWGATGTLARIGCAIQPAISLQFHPESAQKSLQRQSLSKSSYMDMNLGLVWAFWGAFCCWKPVVVVCGRGIDSHNFSRGGPSSERRRIQWRHYRPIFQIFFLLNNL